MSSFRRFRWTSRAGVCARLIRFLRGTARVRDARAPAAAALLARWATAAHAAALRDLVASDLPPPVRAQLLRGMLRVGAPPGGEAAALLAALGAAVGRDDWSRWWPLADALAACCEHGGRALADEAVERLGPASRAGVLGVLCDLDGPAASALADALHRRWLDEDRHALEFDACGARAGARVRSPHNVAVLAATFDRWPASRALLLDHVLAGAGEPWGFRGNAGVRGEATRRLAERPELHDALERAGVLPAPVRAERAGVERFRRALAARVREAWGTPRYARPVWHAADGEEGESWYDVDREREAGQRPEVGAREARARAAVRDIGELPDAPALAASLLAWFCRGDVACMRDPDGRPTRDVPHDPTGLVDDLTRVLWKRDRAATRELARRAATARNGHVVLGAVLRAVAWAPHEEDRAWLLWALDAAPPQMRREAVIGLRNLGERGEALTTAARAMLAGASPEDRFEAALALARAGDPEAVGLLRARTLGSPSRVGWPRPSELRALAAHDARAHVDVFLRVLDMEDGGCLCDGCAEAPRAALEGLAKAGDRDALGAALRHVLRLGDRRLAEFAAERMEPPDVPLQGGGASS